MRAHDDEAVAEQDRLVEAVGDVDDGLVRLLPDAQQLVLEHDAGLGVERAERLVHQQDAGLEDDGAGERHALLLAARKFMGIGGGEPVEPDSRQRQMALQHPRIALPQLRRGRTWPGPQRARHIRGAVAILRP